MEGEDNTEKDDLRKQIEFGINTQQSSTDRKRGGGNLTRLSLQIMSDKYENFDSLDAEDKSILTSLEQDLELIRSKRQVASRFHRFGSLSTPSFSTPSTKIEVVEAKIRKKNEDAYSPRVLALGPIHYKNLYEFENYKEVAIQRYLQHVKVKDITRIALEYETFTRSYYDRSITSDINKRDFVMMNIEDSILIIELFLDTPNYDHNLIVPSMKRDVLHDMILLENQIPCLLLMELFVQRAPRDNISLYAWIHSYFQDIGNMSIVVAKEDYQYDHLLDLLWMYHCPTAEIVGIFNYQPVAKRSTYSAKELHKAGIRLVMETDQNKQLLDVEFCVKDGILRIPQLIVNEWSETFYLNLIALERANRQKRQYISSYFIFMENLSKNPEDVELLIKETIIKSDLNNDKIRHIFANLRQIIALDSWEFCFNGLYRELNNYSKSYWHRLNGSWYQWRKMLGRDYFHSPWSTISVIAAFYLLSLATIQTVCSIISLKHE